jgi:hypothetical protein
LERESPARQTAAGAIGFGLKQVVREGGVHRCDVVGVAVADMPISNLGKRPWPTSAASRSGYEEPD